MRRIHDFGRFMSTLPYASEIFGVYRPMLGWQSRRSVERFTRGFAHDLAGLRDLEFRNSLVSARIGAVAAPGSGRPARGAQVRVESIEPAGPPRDLGRRGSFLLEAIASSLPEDPTDDPAIWRRLLNEQSVARFLNERVLANINRTLADPALREDIGAEANELLLGQAADESRIARQLIDLAERGDFGQLRKVFYGSARLGSKVASLATFRDPFDYIDPHRDLDRVSLSPIGIVHLFRQYFFEFDTFLGPPVEHVWLSPGAQVELIETTTRKRLVERTIENESEMKIASESISATTDELSDAVKQENRSDTKFGANAKVEQGWIGGSAEATTSINLDKTQAQARETAHKRMRQQTDKLSSEIRKSFKSTFRTVTEATDTSSKRYLLNNTTAQLINYELRRKMRQVGVQVQDIGTYLCWQTYVDDPGRQLGIAELVHLASSPEIGAIPPPESIPVPEAVISETPLSIPFEPRTGDTTGDDMDEVYRNGQEVNTDFNEGDPEKVRYRFGPFEAICPASGYVFESLAFDYQNNDIRCSPYDVTPMGDGRISFRVMVNHVNFRNVSPLSIVALARWSPTQATLDDVALRNAANRDKYTAETQLAFRRAYVEAARERINLASMVRKRDYVALREEERIVVYRALIQDMLTRNLPLTDDRTRHAVSEVLNSIFDIEKMLYFVAPEWWRPRLHQSGQRFGTDELSGQGGRSGVGGGLGGKVSAQSLHALSRLTRVTPIAEATSKIAPDHTVTWGGHAGRVDNYYVTEDSEPAPLGASLGWLLQLDGDDFRNAFLNAPWVKAVIPIRPGREKAAMNWLSRLEVEGSEGLDGLYAAPADELAQIPASGPAPTLRDAIDHLCTQIAAKHEAATSVGRFPAEEVNDDNRVAAAPVDKVYEHGFYPIQGGFRLTPSAPFEVFDQWVEILPTDQIVPVEVTYDPITGRQIT